MSDLPGSGSADRPEPGARHRNGGPLLLGDQAYNAIKEAIITHRLAPGERVSEGSLARAFGFGKAPIRTAMSRLAEDDLIVARGSKSQVVAPLTLADVYDIFGFRVLLEPEAARRAAQDAPVAELRRLNELCERPYTLGDRTQELQSLRANRDWHLALARASRSPRLAKWLEQLQDASLRVLWYSLQVSDLPQMWSHGHEEITDALERHDAEGAAAKVREHLLSSQQRIIELLVRSEDFKNLQLMSRT